MSAVLPRCLPSCGLGTLTFGLQLFNQILRRGSYACKVDADLAKHRADLTKLAAAVASFKPTSMQQMVDFVCHQQQQLLDQLYDERAVLKQIPDWPAAKWEAMWEAAVVHGQMMDLQQQCLQHLCIPASSGNTSSSSLAEAVAAAQKTYSHVRSKLEAFQRQESAFEKKMRSQGIPWNGQQLVAAVKEASVHLGTSYITAVLALLAEGHAKMQKQLQKQQLGASLAAEAAAVAAAAATAAAAGGSQPGSPKAAAAAGPAPVLWGCPVRDPKQQQRLQKLFLRQLQQHQQQRQQQLEDAVTFVFKLHQFAGGLDDSCREAFMQLVAEVEAPMSAAVPVAV